MELTTEQASAARTVARALRKAAKAGLSMRVFDGGVLLMTSEHLRDHRYCSSGMDDWLNECVDVGNGISADGGAGV